MSGYDDALFGSTAWDDYFDSSDSSGWATAVDGGAIDGTTPFLRDGSRRLTPLRPMYKLPFPSSCGRALAGHLRHPSTPSLDHLANGHAPCDTVPDYSVTDNEDSNFGHNSLTNYCDPFDDDENWEKMPGWLTPALSLSAVDTDHLHQRQQLMLGRTKGDMAADDESCEEPALSPQEMPIPSIVVDVTFSPMTVKISERQVTMLRQLLVLTDGAPTDVVVVVQW